MQNILLVTVDSLRADRLTDQFMPATSEFAEGAMSFTNTFANGPSTPASFPAIHASRHFASIEGLGIPESGEGIVTLAERLSDAGYDTAGFTDNHFASGDYNFDRGFDTLHDASGTAEAGRLKQMVQSNLDKGSTLFRTIESIYTRIDALVSTATGNGSEYERAGSLNSRAIEWIEGREGPWFVWLHYMDVHHPYEAPPKYQKKFLDSPLSVSQCRALSRKATHHPEEMEEEEWEHLIDLYNAECAYTDEQFRHLLSELDQRDLREDLVTLFTSDHGELLGEHNKGGHPPEFWEETIHVPFILEGAGKEGKQNGQIRLLDLAPTLTDAIDIEPSTEWQGESALDLDEGEGREFAFGDVGRQIDYQRCYARRSDGWKLLRHAEGNSVSGNICQYLFKVNEISIENTDENKFGEGLVEETELANALDRHRNDMRAMRSGSRAVEEGSEMVEEHLEDLGYLE